MTESLALLQARLHIVSTELQNIQRDLTNAIVLRRKLEVRRYENEAVQEDMEALPAGSVVYKQVGSGLVQQSVEDIRKNVRTRMEFIMNELNQAEIRAAELRGRWERKKVQVIDVRLEIAQRTRYDVGLMTVVV
ncbi:hypothetical protein EUX98_g6024 [Antrodiella citrinella]|uniref:Prefoldin subunit 1 n=1 Tax=Antrodiella citrinella TaxID=2447956 RepID=A0A4S4MXM2_9APHY|nr:hypothetical protein EUX98_g6024 [Antrodiella citrinella]